MKYWATNAISQFKCLQADCPDTCCKGWSMQVEDQTFRKYKGTELENAIAYDGQNGEIRVMARNPETDYCVKFDNGLCGIHAEKGADMLGDACFFYPRITRQFGEEVIMTATLSCPEVARLMLYESHPTKFVEQEITRFPNMLKDYLHEGLDFKSIMQVHESFLEICHTQEKPERIMAKIFSASQSLDRINKADWVGAAPFMLKMAEGKLPAPEIHIDDSLKVLQAFIGVLHATRKKVSPLVSINIEEAEKTLGITINWQSLLYENVNVDKLSSALKLWILNRNLYNEVLRKYIEAQLSFTTFPFAGLGESLEQKAKLLVYKFALMRLFIMCNIREGETLTEQRIIQIIHPISRVVDHIGDPVLILNLMNDLGWNSDARIRGLLWDETD